MPLDPTASLAAIAAATLVSEDLTCIGVGLLVAGGQIGFWPGTLACLVGIVGGDLLLFAAGRTLGRAAIERGPLRRIVSPLAFDRSSRWLERHGLAVVLLSRLTPGARLPTYVAAGALRTRATAFAGFFVVAAVVWTPLLVGVAAWSGAQAGGRPGAGLGSATQAGALLATLVAVARVVPPLFTWRGRRRAIGWLRRVLRWEFWPLPLAYAPVAVWIAYLALRHRSLTLPTAVNPGIPGGGLAGESKFAILEALRPQAPGAVAADGPRLAELVPDRWLQLVRVSGALSASRRLAVTEAFLEEAGLSLPVVVKPDLGERGFQVTIARDRAALATALARPGGDWLVQEFAPGPEFGIFYVRSPEQSRGQIFSLTEKRLPHVVGDGRRTLEELVLADERAVCLAERYLERFGAARDDVPAAGQVIPLVELGTHSRGAVFRDARHLITPELEAAVDRIARRFRGFHFGRFDVRVPCVDDLRTGRRLAVLELNGLTAEATHIYDPAVGIVDAYRALFAQWRIAFEIGERNRAAGARPTTLRQITELLSARRHARGAAPRRGTIAATRGAANPPAQRPATSLGQF